MNFWASLKKPFFVLAPMDDVTDVVFRQMVSEIAPPDVFFTEFTNVEALVSKGRASQITRLKFIRDQKPIVAQIWGNNPENYFKVAQELVGMDFDGIDINMGCPDKGVCKNGGCSALINEPTRAAEIIAATKQGAEKLPVSVKTRIGYSKIQTAEWIPFLLDQGLAALTIHGRTRKEMSKVPAHWDEIKKAVKIRNSLGVETLIIGNGDVVDRVEGLKKVKESGVDGIMIGRGIFKNLWCFGEKPEKSEKEMLELLLKHARAFDKEWGKDKNFQVLRKFFKIYVSDFPQAHNLRIKLMETGNLAEVESLFNSL